MPSVFFPGPVFGWAFLAILAALLTVASISDLRTAVIPKGLTLSAAGLGFVFNMIRCGILASEAKPTWWFHEGGVVLGGLDGFLFALSGLFFSFAIFTGLWILGICGGGDVKLAAALGAWVGPLLSIYVLGVTILVLMVIIVFQAVIAVFSGNLKDVQKRKPRSAGSKPKRRLITFALPLSISVAVVLAWTLRQELNLVPPAVNAINLIGGCHAC